MLFESVGINTKLCFMAKDFTLSRLYFGLIGLSACLFNLYFNLKNKILNFNNFVSNFEYTFSQNICITELQQKIEKKFAPTFLC